MQYDIYIINVLIICQVYVLYQQITDNKTIKSSSSDMTSNDLVFPVI